MSCFCLKDKVVVITGASSGIGEAIAIEVADKGAKLVLAARNIEKLNILANIISKKGNEVLWKITKNSIKHIVLLDTMCFVILPQLLLYVFFYTLP